MLSLRNKKTFQKHLKNPILSGALLNTASRGSAFYSPPHFSGGVLWYIPSGVCPSAPFRTITWVFVHGMFSNFAYILLSEMWYGIVNGKNPYIFSSPELAGYRNVRRTCGRTRRPSLNFLACVHSRENSFDPKFMKLCQNVNHHNV